MVRPSTRRFHSRDSPPEFHSNPLRDDRSREISRHLARTLIRQTTTRQTKSKTFSLLPTKHALQAPRRLKNRRHPKPERRAGRQKPDAYALRRPATRATVPRLRSRSAL